MHAMLDNIKCTDVAKGLEIVWQLVVKIKQGVALTGRNMTGPSVRRLVSYVAYAPRYRRRQTTTTDANRHQRAKQYWSIRRASKKLNCIFERCTKKSSFLEELSEINSLIKFTVTRMPTY